MRGPMQAMAVVAGFTLLSVLIPPVSYLSSAAVALVTLRQGLKPGLILVIGASIFIAGVSLFVGEESGLKSTLASLIALSLIIWMLSGILRYTRSLPMTFIASGTVGLVVILVLHGVLGDPTKWWEQVLTQLFLPAIEQASPSEQQEFLEVIASWAPHVTGFVAAALALNSLLCLFIGRWWQAMLYNPGGFQTEFHGLRLGKHIAIATLVVALLTLVPMGEISVIATDLLMIMLTLYVLQGIAVAHAVVAMKKMNVGWLVGLYIVVFLMSQLVAVAGFIDTFVNFRQRIAGKSS